VEDVMGRDAEAPKVPNGKIGLRQTHEVVKRGFFSGQSFRFAYGGWKQAQLYLAVDLHLAQFRRHPGACEEASAVI